VIIGGLSLAVIIGLYLFLQRYLPLKEFFVAGLYTFGVLLPSWRLKVDLISGDHVLLIGQFFSVALVNLLLFSWFELKTIFRTDILPWPFDGEKHFVQNLLSYLAL
jgi:hypothetical protein